MNSIKIEYVGGERERGREGREGGREDMEGERDEASAQREREMRPVLNLFSQTAKNFPEFSIIGWNIIPNQTSIRDTFSNSSHHC